ncbi:MAG: glycoside hydrolase [Ignavibacteriales bacterium CG18_big_fil_WC_8_21_14_2_50_31_20]|nr:MAG: glycoside hydrolase [Ignavibacteriales bacterium CG18_big_fil_WC_8_21_14_2_50_31_20]
MLQNNILKSSFRILVILIFTLSCSNSEGITNENTEFSIVEKHGQLSISGTNLVDSSGEIIVLRGMSLFWSQWGDDYYNEETIKWLRDDWKCTVIRVAMGVEGGGYLENSSVEFQKASSVIDACIKFGIYVIIDWHDHHAESHTNEAISFFHNISLKYGNQPNIIYELYNEPLAVSWKEIIKPYAESVINTIRKNGSKNVIIIGTPNWSQDVEDVINNRINDNNLAYVFHFYSSTHTADLRNKAFSSINAGIPLFVSEWGLSEASGNGNINLAESKIWMNFLEQYNLSWCNWSVMNKDESSAALLPTTTNLSGWNESQLSQSGKMIREYLIKENSSLFNQ